MSGYAQLMERIKRMGALHDAAEILEWDQQVCMPPGGTEARAAQVAAISATMHEILTSPETGRLLAEAERAEGDEAHRAALRELRFAYDRETRVPVALVEKLSLAQSRGYEAWVEAKKASSFAAFAPALEELVRLKKEYAKHVEPDKPAYEALFRDYEPWIPLAEARRNLVELRAGIKPLVEKAKRQPARPDPFAGHWPKEKQDALCRKVAAMIGYDFQRGRLDVSPHPFSAGGPHDARITTRWDESTPVSGLLGVVHEVGHATYMQGLPAEHMGTPLGEARDLVVHESQSRLWENHVGRSLPFWQKVAPMMRESFGRAPSPEEAWRGVNLVEPSLIRVEADEITYHLHVALRLEIEEAIFADKLPIHEVPHRWNETVKRDLGLDVPDDARGCLQDMHWSTGSFGYFPTYSLGSLLSAQLMEAYARAGPPDDYGALLAWLRANVHAHGKRYTTGDLVARATGRPLSPDAFLRYAKEKYARVWAG